MPNFTAADKNEVEVKHLTLIFIHIMTCAFVNLVYMYARGLVFAGGLEYTLVSTNFCAHL